MNQNDKVEFYIELTADYITEDELDYLTRQLLIPLGQTDIESAKVTRGENAPRTTKSGEEVKIGSIMISHLTTLLPAATALASAGSISPQGQTVNFKGKGIEFEVPPEELLKLLTITEKGKKK